jgi:ubiquinone/menaquinone biosynthesis C-methylase UbiE/uncharacterized protein YbaR (Trm112 family)
MLACPDCRAVLAAAEPQSLHLRCGACRRIFPVKQGIVFLAPETRSPVPSSEEFVCFDAHAAYYDRTRYGSGFNPKAVAELIREASALNARSVILDLGGGTGMLSRPFARLGFDTITGDISLPMLEAYFAKLTPAERKHALLLLSDARRLPLAAQSVDLLIERHVISLIEDWRQVLREIRRVLKPSGSLVLLADAEKRILKSAFDESEINRVYWNFLEQHGQGEADRPGVSTAELLEHLQQGPACETIEDPRLSYSKRRTVDDILYDMVHRTSTRQRRLDGEINARAVEHVRTTLQAAWGDGCGRFEQEEAHALRMYKLKWPVLH